MVSFIHRKCIKNKTVVKENERKEITTLKGIYFSQEVTSWNRVLNI